MKKAKIIIIAVVLVLVLIVILQNTESVETRFLFAKMIMPRAFLLMLTFLFGFVAGSLVTFGFETKTKTQAYRFGGKIGIGHDGADVETDAGASEEAE